VVNLCLFFHFLYKRMDLLLKLCKTVKREREREQSKFSVHHHVNIFWLSFTNHFANQLTVFDGNILLFLICLYITPSLQRLSSYFVLAKVINCPSADFAQWVSLLS
jgi:hypothetical protein